MSSDTPLTDAQILRQVVSAVEFGGHVMPVANADFARVLERQLATARAEIEELKHDNERHIAIASEAQTEVESLRAKLKEAERDAAAYQWGLANARWIQHDHEAYVAVPVALKADLSCIAMRRRAIDAAMQAKEGE